MFCMGSLLSFSARKRLLCHLEDTKESFGILRYSSKEIILYARHSSDKHFSSFLNNEFSGSRTIKTLTRSIRSRLRRLGIKLHLKCIHLYSISAQGSGILN
eukprot:NODE_905_length_3200_cov_0.362786.p3 type:complete len:101 gc:universal NODE_905_length_3200_cov_0.362786:1730-1428(-)